MALDEGDKAIIRQIAFDASEHTFARIEKSMKENTKMLVNLHQAECPVRDKVEAGKHLAMGGWRVLAFLGGLAGTVAALALSLYNTFRSK